MVLTRPQLQKRRRPSGRAAFFVLALVATALVLPAPADAVLLWKRKQAGGPQGSGTASTPLAAPEAPRAGYSGGEGLAAQAASVLKAPAELPDPAAVANYPHELRRLEEGHAGLAGSMGAERAAALVEYGNVLADLSRDAPAALAYLQALELEPGLQAAWNNLGSLARRAGHLGLAQSIFSSILSDDPEAGLAWFNLGLTLDATGDWVDAEEAYVQALTYAPELWSPQVNPLIVGNERALHAVHRRYLQRSGRGSILLDSAR